MIASCAKPTFENTLEHPGPLAEDFEAEILTGQRLGAKTTLLR